MSIFDRYVFRTVMGTTGLVMLILLALSGFVNFTAQLKYVGEGDFTLFSAMLVLLLQWPRQAFDMLPIAALLGSLLGLGALANNSELVAIRAAGVSIWRVARGVAITGMVLATITLALGEFVAPPADRLAQDYTARMTGRGGAVSGLSGSWMRDGDQLLNILQVEGPNRFGGVYVYELDGDGRLASVSRSRVATVVEADRWQLDDVSVTRFRPDGLEVEELDRTLIDTDVDREVLELSLVEPDSLSTEALMEYVRYLKDNGLDAVRYEQVMWARYASSAAAVAMALLAVPFVFGPLRTGGNSGRFVVGFLIGIGYFLVNGMLASGGEIYELSPVLTAWLPMAALTLVALIGISRTR
jgi:lipopolysaccharide export system permease protein